MGAPETTPSTPSLRERSKARRRELIRRTAMRLFAERGYDRATIADIAAEAEVAPRTVTMYFASKADIAMSLPNEIAGRLVVIFRENPSIGFTDAIDQWLTAEAEHLDPELIALTSAMFQASPGLRSLSSAELGEAVEAGAPAFGAETGLPADHPLGAVIGAAVGAAVGEYLTVVLHAGNRPELHTAFMRTIRATVRSAR
ncbi:TetR/AcrR family transcriptional regulator [Streptomyces sp. NBC_01262]|jgi:AcrR family transcriptional regulator|uniref:TetR/AcrR family transcriptional regulator n=1 Tax=Streptomyces sp. NBC_01262 TaxID=2903803 RepID=UPI002E300B16|nr:helix-turn-helix domain-containing protein [Streptomyces sp. NBC_01262]